MSEHHIAEIIEQERRLVLRSFDDDIAFRLGCNLRERAVASASPVTIEIRSAARRYFFTTLAGSAPDNEDWGRRKINTVLRTAKSSMRVGLELARDGRSQWPDAGLPHADFVNHGGGFPITLGGFGVIAAIGISGLPSIDDHEMATAMLADHLGITDIALTRNNGFPK